MKRRSLLFGLFNDIIPNYQLNTSSSVLREGGTPAQMFERGSCSNCGNEHLEKLGSLPIGASGLDGVGDPYFAQVAWMPDMHFRRCPECGTLSAKPNKK